MTPTSMTPPEGQPRLTALPVELLQSIMGFILSATSLFSFMRTSRSVYECYKGAEPILLSKVIHNQIIDHRLMNLVKRVSQAKNSGPWTSKSVRRLLNRKNKAVDITWTMSQALSADRLHRSIKFFYMDFINQHIKWRDVKDEWYLTMHVFYLLELRYALVYSANIPLHARLTTAEQRWYFGYSLNWQENQLNEICHYLCRRTYPEDYRIYGLNQAFSLMQSQPQRFLLGTQGTKKSHEEP